MADYTAEQREALLRACEDQDCDGQRHTCWNCGGEGFVEPEDWQDEEDEPCSQCGGRGGWPCPLSISTERR